MILLYIIVRQSTSRRHEAATKQCLLSKHQQSIAYQAKMLQQFQSSIQKFLDKRDPDKQKGRLLWLSVLSCYMVLS